MAIQDITNWLKKNYAEGLSWNNLAEKERHYIWQKLNLSGETNDDIDAAISQYFKEDKMKIGQVLEHDGRIWKIVDKHSDGTFDAITVPPSNPDVLEHVSEDYFGGAYGPGAGDFEVEQAAGEEAAEEALMEKQKFIEDALYSLKEIASLDKKKLNNRVALETEISRELASNNWSSPQIPKIVKGILDKFYKNKDAYLKKWGIK
jgi:hypothetical protein